MQEAPSQKPAPPRAATAAPSDPLAAIRRAARLAEQTLDGNIWRVRVREDPVERPVILAGTGKFDALWARDACYASLGALATGRAEAVKGTLETLLANQSEDGWIPRRIAKGSAEAYAIRYGLGLARARSPHFDTVDRQSPSHIFGISGVICPDTNLLVLHVAAEYVERTGDAAFLDAALPRLERALVWLRARAPAGLVRQEPISDWKDTADRGEVTLYNQVLYFQALRSLAALRARRGDAAGAAALRADAERLARLVRDDFWDPAGGFFRDAEGFPHFSPDGNLIAVACGLASAEERRRIFARVDRCLEGRALLPATDPDYPPSRIPLAVRMVGLRHYHDAFAWPWQESMLAIAAVRAGECARAERALLAVALLAERDGGFFEVYEGPSPRLVSRRFYKSEPGFSWSAGLFLRAFELLREQERVRSVASPQGELEGR